MGAAPSRETLQRGLYAVRPPAGGNLGGNKKQDIVLIPLTKEFFPSPDCPLFEQFHRTRCDAGVSYYFRRPGNPGDLSRIPATENGDDESSYPSREALYRGVVERIEEMLFDTDEEMRQAYEQSLARGSSGKDGTKKRVLPILCAVAFRYDPSKLWQQGGNGCPGNLPHLQTLMEQGVPLGDSIVNIVGCFGFVPMEVEGLNVARSNFSSANSGCQTHYSYQSPSCFSGPEGSFLSGQHQRVSSLHSPLLSVLARERREDFSSSLPGHHQRLGTSCTSTLGSSLASPPSYDPHRPLNQQQSNVSASPVRKPVLLKNTCGDNHEHFVSLPFPVAAPLAAIVFITKSAGEQNLSRVTFIAASMYYNQLIDAGLLQRPVTQGPPSPFSTKPRMPPLDTFSFSSLMTNVPIISFVHEMRSRWEQFGILSYLGDPPLSKASPLNSPLSSFCATTSAFVSRTDMEMWITDDNMFHGRIGKELAEVLCFCLAENPDRMLRRVEPLSNAKRLWRFRGLVNRNHPPPLPRSEGGETSVDDLDVYVMGAAVMDGFDEGDVLRFDAEKHLWVADRTIPLDTVVLAAMRPHCKAAREAPPNDPGWVTVEEGENGEQDGGRGGNNGNGGACAVGASESKGVGKRRVHVRKGNFYIYRFVLNGRTYYHGTVPDFANPNKGAAAQQTSFLLNTEKHHDGVVKNTSLYSKPAVSKEEESVGQAEAKKGPALGDRSPPSITTALFSLAPDGIDKENQVGNTDYLPTRVTSAAMNTAKRWMDTLLNYAMGSSPGGEGVPITPASLPLSPKLGPSGGSTPLTRRKSIVVQVGPGAEQSVPPEKEVQENNKGLVKRFLRGAEYVWDWRRS